MWCAIMIYMHYINYLSGAWLDIVLSLFSDSTRYFWVLSTKNKRKRRKKICSDHELNKNVIDFICSTVLVCNHNNKCRIEKKNWHVNLICVRHDAWFCPFLKKIYWFSLYIHCLTWFRNMTQILIFLIQSHLFNMVYLPSFSSIFVQYTFLLLTVSVVDLPWWMIYFFVFDMCLIKLFFKFRNWFYN